MIPVLGFATVSRFDMADKLLASIDYPVENLVIVNNSGKRSWTPAHPIQVKHLWHIQVPYGLGANGAWNLIIKSTPFAPYWVLPNDDCEFVPGALQTIAENVDPTKFNLVDVIPTWSCVIPTEGSVSKGGLWDEAFHPIYFDDNDLERRLVKAGVEFHNIAAKVKHQNSSSIAEPNGKTFKANGELLHKKVENDDFSVHGWSLDIRRENAWDSMR